MSFVYIDSQGREVKIPSVDAVRLRIELGAIKDQTRFFDSNTGKWAPAAEHEIYRTLKRQLVEAEQGFVAPPPPSMASGDAPGAGAPGPGSPAEAPPEGEASPDPDGPVAEAAPEAAEAAPEAGVDSDTDSADPEFGEITGLEVAPMEDGPAEEAPSDPSPGTSAPEATGEEVDPFVTSAEDELLGGLDDHGAGALDDQGLDLEPSLAESFSGAPEAGPSSGSPPPEPVSGPGDEFHAEADDGWSGEPDPPETPAETPSGSDPFDSVWESPDDHRPESSADSFDADHASHGEDVAPVPQPRTGGAPPQRKLTRARTPGADRIVGIVGLVAVVGAVMFFGWRFLSPALGGGSGEPEITMPPLDQELVPRMRQLAGRASARMTQDMLGLPEARAVPEEPSEDWLAGIYLAGASQYPNVPEYWGAIRDWVEASRTSENALFREALLAQLDTANLAASDSEAIRDRALAGFQAASSDRRIVYDQMQQVAERSIVLHEFLVANEDAISYEPAGSGISRDPVLEAVPSSEALGDEMWEMVGGITSAMDALGYLDRIDTERLLGVFLEKLEATAIR